MIRRRPSHKHGVWTETSGTTAVEFALVLPVLLVSIFAAWSIGLGIYYGGEVRHAVELGSRIYVVNGSATADQFRTAVASHLLDVPIGSITLTPTSGSVGGAAAEVIPWSYRTTASIPFIPAIPMRFSGTVTVPAAAS